MRRQASRLTDKFKDRNGDTTITNFDLDLLVDVNLRAYTPKKKFLGATVGGGEFRGEFRLNVGAFICPWPADRVYSCPKVSTYGLKILCP